MNPFKFLGQATLGATGAAMYGAGRVAMVGARAGLKGGHFMLHHPAIPATLGIGGLAGAYLYNQAHPSLDLSSAELTPMANQSTTLSSFQNSAAGLSFGMHRRRHG